MSSLLSATACCGLTVLGTVLPADAAPVAPAASSASLAAATHLAGPASRAEATGAAAVLGCGAADFRDCAQSRHLGRWARVAFPADPSAWLGPQADRTSRGAAARPIRRIANYTGPASRAAISGTVRSASGRGLPGICVTAIPRETSNPHQPGAVTLRSGRGGRYSFPSSEVPPFRWVISFNVLCAHPANYAPQWWRYAPTRHHATVLRLRAGEHLTGINARLVTGAAIAGTVRGGQPSHPLVAGVCVEAFGTGSMSAVGGEAVTGRSGTYKVIGLGTGRYQVEFLPSCGATGNYLDSSYPRLVFAADGKVTKGIDGVLPLAATIEGTVTAGVSGTPVGGICVDAGSSNGGGSATTDSHGGFAIGFLAAGTYTVSFSGGCGNSGSYAPQSYNGRANAAAADPVVVTAGQVLTGINASMQPGGTVTGTVTSRSGKPLSRVCVMLTSPQDAGGLGQNSVQLLPLFTALGATANGTYKVRNLTPGSYEVSFLSGCGRVAASHAASWFSPQGTNRPAWVSVPPGIVTSHVGARLPAAGTITGVVRNSAGQRLPGICPLAVPLTGQPSNVFVQAFSGTTKTNRHGAYRITGLAAGKYAVVFGPCVTQPYAISWYRGVSGMATARPVTVTDGRATTGINQVMTAGQAIAGRITSAVTGRSAAHGCVAAFASGGIVEGTANANRNGDYRIGRLAAGRYDLVFAQCTARPTGLAAVTRRGVRVGSRRARTGVNAALPRAGSVAGTVLGGSPPAAVPGSCVDAIPKTGGGATGVTIAGADGSYQLPGLAPGSYLIEFTALCLAGPGAFVPQWYNDRATRATADPVSVSAGTTHSGIGATLIADGGIAGTVQASGTPAAGVCVIAYPSAGRRVPSAALTAPDGSYQIGGLPPGSYLVEFTAGCGVASYVTQWYNGASSRSGATRVTVSQGAVTTGIDAH